jgi:arginyl-tRNA synthetase
MEDQLIQVLQKALFALYQIENTTPVIEPTRADVDGDFTFVVFPYLKQSKKGPEQTAKEIGDYILKNEPIIVHAEVIKGFLNLTLSPAFWLRFLHTEANNPSYGKVPAQQHTKILVEYSSPNTNKPLHLGHIRNNLLGYAVSKILQANGYDVKTCNLINDRGIHICKSMLAWQQFGSGETPASSGLKGDHLVGKYYVLFDKQYKQEIKELIAKGKSEDEAEKLAPSILQAQEMLRKWEAGDADTIQLWETMNEWVYAGFASTYANLGVTFDKYYYESNTYLLGKEIVQEGLSKKVFYKKDDGSVWVDLTEQGLDQKLLLRGDGTSVYITQDIGTAELKYADFNCTRSIYVVGNEQDYHFKVLQHICKLLDKPYADGIYHLSYGMVELPEGKMKSREGTVVDADDLIAEMIQSAKDTTAALGKTQDMEAEYLDQLYQTLGLGALKYFILKVDPKKKMLFNPAESIDMHGNTGPFIQYTYARIRSILRLAGDISTNLPQPTHILPAEMQLFKILQRYPQAVKDAGRELSPGVIANYAYEVAKAYNHFYHECPILKEADEETKHMRLYLCKLTAHTINTAFELLGIAVPEKM